MRFIINLLITGAIIAISAWIIPGVQGAGFGWAILTGLVIGLVNASVGSILRFMTFPLNWLTIGLVSFIITVLMIMLSDKIMGIKYEVGGFWNALVFAIAIAIVEAFFSLFLDRSKD